MTFVPPTGLHPKMSIKLSRKLLPPSPGCALHSYFTIPSYLFVDQYQLSSPNFLASVNLHSVRSISGRTDLEAPDWATSKWGSALLLELAPPKPTVRDIEGPWHVEVPFHIRYVEPSGTSEQVGLQMPWPTVFWACHSDEGTKMSTNPFDRVNLGYDGLFGSQTVFYHLQPTNYGQPRIEQLEAPLMNVKGASWVEYGTVSTVLCGFAWICWKLLCIVDIKSSHEIDKGKKDE